MKLLLPSSIAISSIGIIFFIATVHASNLSTLQTCEIIRIKKEIECPEVPPPKLPRKCSGYSASWQGDPHIRTFDRVRYDCQGEGEFNVLKSLDSDFSLQARFERYDPRRQPTITTALVLNTGDGQPNVQVNVRQHKDLGCEPYVHLGGNKTRIRDQGEIINGIRIQKTKNSQGGGLVFYYEESGVQLQVWSTNSHLRGCYLSADICLPDCYARKGEKFVGLLGTPDGIKDNDWTKKDGSVVPLQAKDRKAEYDYCVRNWCITDAKDSLFQYHGKNFEDYHRCNLGSYDDKKDSCAANMKKLQGICGTRNQECIVDGCTGGLHAAKDYIKSALNMVDKHCGKEIFFENFDAGIDYSDYGGKVLKKGTSAHANAENQTAYLSLSKEDNTVHKIFNVPNDATMVAVQFLFYEVGGWEGRGVKADHLIIKINGITLSLENFDGRTEDKSREGVTEGIAWELKQLTKSTELGFEYGNGSDQIYRVTMQVSEDIFAQSVLLDFEMSVDMTGGLSDESAGIDDLRITAFQASCAIDCQGVTVIAEDFDSKEYEEDVRSWGKMEQLSNGNFVLGRLYDDIDPISKTFEVSRFAGVAKIEFLVYQFGAWTKQPVGKFLVNIGSIQFDLGPFQPSAVTQQSVLTDIGEVFWKRKQLVSSEDGNQMSGKVYEVYQVEIQVSNEHFSDGYLTVGFDVESENGRDIGAFVDEFKIRLFPEPTKCKKAESTNKYMDKSHSIGSQCPVKKEPEIPKKCYREEETKVCSASPKTMNPTTASPTTLSPTTAPPTGTPTEPTPSPSFTTNPTTEAPTKLTTSPSASPTPMGTSPPTDPPTARTLPPTKPPKGSSSGDPHFKTWSGDKYDYHGECDLTLINHPSFDSGRGLRIQIRTTRIKYFSFIEKVALQIGDEVLEFDNDVENFLINGKKVEANRSHHKTMFAGFMIRRDKKAISVRLSNNMKGGAKIDFHTRKNGFPAVIVDAAHTDIFKGSLGLLGEWKSGRKLARDGKTEIVVNGVEDAAGAAAFALEWQVRDTEPMLFQESRFPQFPTKCSPPKTMPGGRLGMSKARKEAEEACSHWKEDQADCLFDVIATRDVSVAQEGHIVHID